MKAQTNSSQLLKMLTVRQKYTRTDYIHRSYGSKDILNRFPNMKSIKFTNKHNKITKNQSTITKNVDEKAKICPDGLYSSLVSR